MPGFPYFGNAVHAVFPFLKAGFDPCALTRSGFRPVLEQHWNVPPGKQMPARFYARVLECWHYVGELVALADVVDIEPLFANGKSPDLLLVHRGHRVIVEVKTHTPGTHVTRDQQHDTRKQVVGSAQLLAQHEPGSFPVEGYVLTFSNHTQEPLKVKWKHMVTAPCVGV